MRRGGLLCHFLLFICLPIFFLSCTTTTPVPSTTTVDLPESSEYILGSEDVLEVLVWKEADLSKVITIRPDGKISLPVVGDLQAAGLSAEQLRENIRQALTDYVDEPTVTVTVQQINSLKIFIQGEVNQPGVYDLKSNFTLLQAVSLAGGFTEWAKKDRISIFRKDAEKMVTIRVNYDKIISGEDPGQNILLKRGDTIVVP
ncbi:MAG: polysaccharide biosynthesis/export family protein [Deltaproteobacteria bacterium]|nr:polysaccharide biosynthesis/export family protein [Deltaproteobacteria bacterium]